MRDDPRKTLKWLEQELLNEEAPQNVFSEDDDLLRRVDALLEDNPKEAPVGNFSRKSKGARMEQAHVAAQFDEGAAVLTKTKKQLHRDAKLRKQAEKKSNINHNIKGLVFLAILEILGILAILGWWLQ